ncbi:MAG: class I SAM-dependent methyltransferase [Bacteroidota bacterium]
MTHNPNPPNSTANLALARSVGRSVAAGTPLSSAELFALAADAFGGTLAEGAFSPRDAYDAAELGLHLHLLRLDLPLEDDPSDGLAEVERLSALLPSQTRRTAAQNDYQQFSTPAAYAALCSWVSGVGARGSARGSRVIEPSAGTGALCTFALASDATVHANELCDRRADLLAVLLDEAGRDPSRTMTRENADHLDAILPPEARADVVLMNPPFSRTAGRLGSRRVVTVGTDHVLQALKRLDPGGRLVAVLSAGVRRGKTTHRAFFEAVDRTPFRLRADVEVGGAVYRPYGTSVRTRVLVVDREPENAPARSRACVEASVGSVAEALGVLAPVQADRYFG